MNDQLKCINLLEEMGVPYHIETWLNQDSEPVLGGIKVGSVTLVFDREGSFDYAKDGGETLLKEV